MPHGVWVCESVWLRFISTFHWFTYHYSSSSPLSFAFSSIHSPLQSLHLQAGTRRLSRSMPRKRMMGTPVARTLWTLTLMMKLERSWWEFKLFWKRQNKINMLLKTIKMPAMMFATELIWLLTPFRLQESIQWLQTARRRDLRSCLSRVEMWSS